MINYNNTVTFAYTSRSLYTIELEMESCWPVKHFILIQLYIIAYNMYKNTFSGRAFDDPSAKRLCPVTPFASDGRRRICLLTIDEDVFSPTFSNKRVRGRE